MLYSTLLVAASAIAGASAQLLTNATYNTPITCCSVEAGLVPQNLKDAWCEAQTNTCNELCGSVGRVASNGNNCDRTSLQTTCNCSNGTSFGTLQLAPYEQTVPGQMCRFWYDRCINQTDQNLAQQFQCTLARNQQCGNLTTKAATTSSSASPSSSATGGAGSSNPSSTQSGSAPAQSTGAAAAFAVYGTPILAGGLLAIFGIAL